MRALSRLCASLAALGLLFGLAPLVAPAANAGEFQGSYVAEDDYEVTLTIQEAANGSVTGAFGEGPYQFPLTGSAGKGQLTFTAKVEGEMIRGTGELKGGKLHLIIGYMEDGDKGDTEQMVFVRKSAKPTEGPGGPPPGYETPPQPPAAGGWGQPAPPERPAPQPGGGTRPSNPLGGTPPMRPGVNPLGPADPLIGAFADDRVTLQLKSAAPGHYVGTLTIEGTEYPVQARGSARALEGTFTVDGHAFPLSGELAGDLFQLASGGAVYRLKRKAAPRANPLEVPNGGQGQAPRGSPEGGGWGERPVTPPVVVPQPGGNAAGMKTYRHAIGFQFHHPADWQIMEQGGGLTLVPSDAANGPQGPSEGYFVFGELAPNVQRPDDPAVQQKLAQGLMQFAPFLRATGAPAAVPGTQYPSSMTRFEGTSPTGSRIRADVYVAIMGGAVQTMSAMGEPQHLERRQSVVRSIFASFQPAPPALDRALVGTWYAQIHNSAGGTGDRLNMSTTLVSKIKPDGTFEYTSSSAFAAPQGTGGAQGDTTRGRWAAANGVAYFNTEGQGVTAFSYQISGQPGNRAMAATPAGGGTKQLWTERP